MLGLGNQRSAIATSRGHVIRLFWLRRRSARIQRRITCNRKRSRQRIRVASGGLSKRLRDRVGKYRLSPGCYLIADRQRGRGVSALRESEREPGAPQEDGSEKRARAPLQVRARTISCLYEDKTGRKARAPK